jgi:hypothetical protein
MILGIRKIDSSGCPHVATDDRLDPREEEQYLGVLLAPNLCNSANEWEESTLRLLETVSGSEFIEEIADAEEASGNGIEGVRNVPL